MDLFEYMITLFMNIIEELQNESTDLLNKYGGV